MLSSQTKDTVTSVAVRRLQKELKGGLTIQSILKVPSEELNSLIGAVGFHNKKTIYLKQVAAICRDQYHGDIPDTAEALIALPGVGPKMVKAYWTRNRQVRLRACPIYVNAMTLTRSCFHHTIGVSDPAVCLEQVRMLFHR